MSFGQSNINDASASYLFEKGFGAMGVSHEMTYHDPMRSTKKSIGGAYGDAMMKSWEANVQKAPSMTTTTGGSFTEQGLMPSFIDSEVFDLVMKDNPLVGLLPRVAVRGRAYVFNTRSARGSAQFLGENPAISNIQDTYATTTVSMKYLYAKGQVTGPALLSGTIINPMQEAVRSATRSMVEALENEIINGDVSSDPLGFNGLRTSITTNATSLGGAAVGLSDIRAEMATVRENFGRVDLIVMDPTTYAVVKGLLMDFQRYAGEASAQERFGIPGGFFFDGALAIDSHYMPTSASSREMLLLDTRYAALAVLQDISYKELAEVGPSKEFLLSFYGALAIYDEAKHAKLTNIA